jgi:hypothetical protein
MTFLQRISLYTPILCIGLLPNLVGCSGGSSDGETEEPSGADGGAIVTSPDGGGDEGPVGRIGLAGYCDYYKECGGTYYSTAQDCIDASIDYWGDCRQAALDVFGDCMMGIDCSEWNPDAYNPAGTDCSEEWSGVQQASCD